MAPKIQDSISRRAKVCKIVIRELSMCLWKKVKEKKEICARAGGTLHCHAHCLCSAAPRSLRVGGTPSGASRALFDFRGGAHARAGRRATTRTTCVYDSASSSPLTPGRSPAISAIIRAADCHQLCPHMRMCRWPLAYPHIHSHRRLPPRKSKGARCTRRMPPCTAPPGPHAVRYIASRLLLLLLLLPPPRGSEEA